LILIWCCHNIQVGFVATVSKNYSASIFRIYLNSVRIQLGHRADDHSGLEEGEEGKSQSKSLKFVAFSSFACPKDGVSFS
jgi:hypothetical protein